MDIHNKKYLHQATFLNTLIKSFIFNENFMYTYNAF